MANLKIDEKTERLLGSLIIVDNHDTDTTETTSHLSSDKQLLHPVGYKGSALEVADDFLKLTHGRYGFGPASSLFVDFVNMTTGIR